MLLDKEFLLRQILPKIKDLKDIRSHQGYKLSAVMVIIYFKGFEPFIILTKRSSNMAYHRNEIAFPGGTYAIHDRMLINTAIRETKEEIGLLIDKKDILGHIDITKTLTTNFIIFPFITVQDSIPQTIVLTDEVSDILHISLLDLSKNFKYADLNKQNNFQFTHGDNVIWGATARIIQKLLDCIFN